jgi:hypothetical protein
MVSASISLLFFLSLFKVLLLSLSVLRQTASRPVYLSCRATKSRRIRNHTLLSHLRLRPTYLHNLGIGWPNYAPRQCVPFSRPLATRKDTVEVFYPASTRSKTDLAPSLEGIFQLLILSYGPTAKEPRRNREGNTCFCLYVSVLYPMLSTAR